MQTHHRSLLYSGGKNTVALLLFVDEHMLTTPSLQEETVHHHRKMMMDVGGLPNFNWPFINLFAQETDSQRRESWSLGGKDGGHKGPVRAKDQYRCCLNEEKYKKD